MTRYSHYRDHLGTGNGNRNVTQDDSIDAGTRRHDDIDGSVDHDTSRPDTAGPNTSGPDTDDAMTRSEERFHVGTENVETGSARLRKCVVTGNVTTTVPASHEEVRVEREPITDANRGAAEFGADIAEESTRSRCTPSSRSCRRRRCR